MVQGYHIYKDIWSVIKTRPVIVSRNQIFLCRVLIDYLAMQNQACQEYIYVYTLTKFKYNDINCCSYSSAHTYTFIQWELIFTRLFCLTNKVKISTPRKKPAIRYNSALLGHTFLHQRRFYMRYHYFCKVCALL